MSDTIDTLAGVRNALTCYQMGMVTSIPVYEEIEKVRQADIIEAGIAALDLAINCPELARAHRDRLVKIRDEGNIRS